MLMMLTFEVYCILGIVLFLGMPAIAYYAIFKEPKFMYEIQERLEKE